MAIELAPERLRTVHVVPPTAFDADGRLALNPMASLAERLLAAGVSVFLPAAGTGEFHSLTSDEVVQTVRCVRAAIGSDAVLIAPVGFQLPCAIETGANALAAGADAILVMPPAAPYLSDTGLREYYTAIFDTLRAPALFYKRGDFPSDALTLELASHPCVVGIKYAGTGVDAFQRLTASSEVEVEWLCGIAELFAPAFMMHGATGYTTGAGNVCPRLTLAMHAASVRGDWTEALRLQAILRPIEDYRARAGSSYNISFLKHAMQSLGLDFGEPRPPQRRLNVAEKREVEAVVEPILAAESELRQGAVV